MKTQLMNFRNVKLRLLFCLAGLSISTFAFGQSSSDSIYVAKYKSDKSCAISYTFDDGLLEHFTLVFPAFEKLGFHGTFWVNGNTINQGEYGLVNKLPRISWKDLKTMADYGHEISSHGWSHKNLTTCTTEELHIEIDRNDSIIVAKIGERPVTFCYAGNKKNDDVVRIASVNRVGTRTAQFSMGSKSTPENLNEKINSLMNEAGWGVAMIHGITYGYDAFKSDTILWNHLRKVKALEDKIWIGTFRDVAAYTAEQKDIKLLITKKGKKQLITPITTLNKKLFKFPLTMVVGKAGIKKISVKQNNIPLAVQILPDKVLFDFNPHGGKIMVKFH